MKKQKYVSDELTHFVGRSKLDDEARAEEARKEVETWLRKIQMLR